MADFGSPVAGGNAYNPQQGMQTLGALYNIKTAQANLGAAQAQSQQAQQQNQELQALHAFTAKAAQDPAYKNPDGSVNTAKFQQDAMAVAPTYGQAYIGQATQNFTEGVKNKQAILDLSNDQRKTAGGYFAALAANPNATKSDYLDAVEQARQASTDPNYQRSLDSMLLHTPPVDGMPLDKTSQALRQYARTVALSVGAPAAAESAPQMGMVQAPGGMQPVNTNPQSPLGTGAVGPPIKQGLAPTEQIPYQAEKTGTVAQVEQNFKNVSQNRLAASSAPQQLDQIHNAMQIAQVANTGAWTGERSKIESGLSTILPGIDKATDDASKIQILDKFLTRITNDSNRVLGQDASTDAERESISRQNAQIGYTPQAIQSVLKYAGAQTLAMQAKGDAQEAWLKQSGNGITNQQDFETKWRQSYDPKIFQLEEASPAEQATIIKGLSPQEAAALKQKRDQLKAMGVTIQ